ncbi:oxidoreductase domain-containing protein [Fictibacillus macauensis ZFHKF-1]|uniref:Oxidoreductase domain-containing protein n=1 Tax=Fictibacillus macauensis ZFHKF-1 TaxID=1196324 RepID=I8J3G9_9BACL|nr:Gfo/Idh/MocA family oxidoreductase [Fictibacillus macauensis]EIT86321.1 oxidoreductase domain-containing protein [Fictibacillus macauensis ZFHKF-1]
MSLVRVGFIGVGGIAQSRHMPAISSVQDKAVIVSVYDTNKERAKEVARTFKVDHVSDTYEELLSLVDAVVISTPNKFHSEIAIAALQADVHVLCEKPMALTVAECDEMLLAAQKADKVLAIGYHYRYMKNAQAAKKVMFANEIGTPIVIRVQAMRRRKVPGWGVFTNKELQGGGSLMDYGCHLLDLALWLMGDATPVEVSGSQYNTLSKMPEQVNEWGDFDYETFDVDDHVTAYIRFDNGATLLLETSWSANIQADIENVSISGDRGGLDVFPFHVNQAKHGMLLDTVAPYIPGEEDPGISQAIHFIDSCLGLAEPLVKPEEARKVSYLIETIYKSSDLKRSITLS